MSGDRPSTAPPPAVAAGTTLEERYRRLFQYSNDAVLIIGVEGRVVDANRQAVRLFGYPLDELIGLTAADLQTPDAGPQERRTLTGGGAILTEIEFRSKSGRIFPAEVSVSVLPMPDGALIQSAIRDISERRLAERLAVERAGLERANRELDAFASTAAHDIQEPLRKIQAFAARLEGRLATALDEGGRDDLKRLKSAGERLQTLVESLLEYARAETESASFPDVDLAEVARETVADLGAALERSGGSVEIGPLPVIAADRVQIGQLLQNLIGNALKFRRPGQAPRVTVSAASGRDEQGAAVCRLTVADDGIGFDPRQLETILRPFRRLHGRGEYEGSGLGLALCQKIVARHGGSIQARSAPGEGAAFIVTLPVARRTPPPAAS